MKAKAKTTDWGQDWGEGWNEGWTTKGKASPAAQSVEVAIPSPRRPRSGSSVRRRNTTRVKGFIVFVTLLSVALLAYQHYFFHPHHFENAPQPVVAVGGSIKTNTAQPAQTEQSKLEEKTGPGRDAGSPTTSSGERKKKRRKKRREEAKKETTTVPVENAETPQNKPAEDTKPAAQEARPAAQEPKPVEENPDMREEEREDPPEGGVEVPPLETPPLSEKEELANFSRSNFNHADPCNSTLARLAAENITFFANESSCGPEGLPIVLTPDLYKLPDLSHLFVHCENWKDALSSSVEKTELIAACGAGANSTLPLNTRQVLKPYRDLTRRFNKRPLSCAVVGSSSQIYANPDFGQQIDKHHVVIRLNQAPTNGSCSRYTGSKTTIRILNGRWTYKYIHLDRNAFLPLEKDSLVVVSRTTGKDYERLAKKLRATRPDVSVRLLSREVIGVSKQLVKSYKMEAKEKLKVGFKGGDTPSSGLVALVIALNICSKVSLYGFGVLDRDFRRARYARKFYHYFSHMMGKQLEDDTHSFNAELALMASLGQHRSTVTFCGISRELNYTVPEWQADHQ